MLPLFITFLLTTSSSAKESAKNAKSERALQAELFNEEYRTDARPVKDLTKPVVVDLEMHIASIVRLDSTAEQIQLQLLIIRKWVDDYLTWDPKEWSNVTELSAAPTSIWVPDIEVVNSVNVKNLLDQGARFASNGSVEVKQVKVATFACSVDVQDFPFDFQLCQFVVGSARYRRTELIYEPISNLHLPILKTNAEWQVKLFNIQRLDIDVYSSNNNPLILCYLMIQRNSKYYVMVLLIPTFLIVTIHLIGMFAPSEAGGERNEKVSFGLTTLLAMSVILSLVADQTPKTSGNMPLLAKFVVTEIIITTASIILGVIVIIAHERVLCRRVTPPSWLRRFMLCSSERPKANGPSSAVTLTLKNLAEKQDSKAQQFLQLPEVQSALKTLNRFSEELEANAEEAENTRTWQEIFVRIDMALMVLLLLVNTIVSLVLLMPAAFAEPTFKDLLERVTARGSI